MFIDSHCHLDFPQFAGDLPAVIAAMRENEVSAALTVATSLKAATRAAQIAKEYRGVVFAAVGVHPLEEEQCADADALIRVCRENKALAVGETGLDFFRVAPDSAAAEKQRAGFDAHIQAAKILGLPLIIHTRNSITATLEVLRQAAPPAGGVLHCFTGDAAQARAAFDLGFFVSFSGIVTFNKNADALREIAADAPADKYLIETDAPYLAPVPHRGKRNEPAFVTFTAKAVAAARNTTPQQVGEETAANFRRLFHPPD
jgi:TatD DNase family protein